MIEFTGGEVGLRPLNQYRMGENTMPDKKDYLHTCLDLHSDLMEILYGSIQDIGEIENAAAEIRKSGRLAYNDLENILDRNIWDADMFGYWPGRQEIESILNCKIWNFQELPGNEDQVIADMYSIFRQIEPVSVILRFVVPKEYGIISPPMEKVLGINSFGSHRIDPEKFYLERYKAYLRDLRSLKDERRFDRVADVDMALWVLQIGVLEEKFRDREYQQILQNDFRQDSRLRIIQVRNLTRHLFHPDTMRRLDLAEALLETDIHLAGQIAGVEFERSIKRRTGARPEDWLGNEVNRFCQGRPYEFEVRCRRSLGTRNRTAHPDPSPRLKRDEIQDLVDVIRQINRM